MDMTQLDSANLARLCSLDSGVEVSADDVRNYLLTGDAALEHFDAEAQHEIRMTLLKELAST